MHDDPALAAGSRGTTVSRPERLAVDPTACRAHGLCAGMLPDLVRLDEWGYPVLPADPIPRRRRRDVRATVRACPTLALRLRVVATDPVDQGSTSTSAGTT